MFPDSLFHLRPSTRSRSGCVSSGLSSAAKERLSIRRSSSQLLLRVALALRKQGRAGMLRVASMLGFRWAEEFRGLPSGGGPHHQSKFLHRPHF